MTEPNPRCACGHTRWILAVRRWLVGSQYAKPYIGELGPEPRDDLGGGRIVRPADLLAAASDDDPEPTS